MRHAIAWTIDAYVYLAAELKSYFCDEKTVFIGIPMKCRASDANLGCISVASLIKPLSKRSGSV